MEALGANRGLLTLREAAKYLAVSERTVWEYARRGEIQDVRIGRARRFYIEDLKAFIQRMRGGHGRGE